MAGLYIKLDVDFWDHPKIVTAGVMAGVLYQRMSMYCMQHTTDGFVPAAQLARFALPAANRLTAALVDGGLIERTDGGWLVPGYVERYLSAAELERRRQTNVENGRKGGRPRTEQKPRSVSDGLADGLCDTKPNENQEVDVEVDVEPPSSSDTSAARPVMAADEDDEDDPPTELLRIAGLPRATPTAGERAIVAKLLVRGWPADQLRAMALRASQADVDPRAYLAKLLGEALNSPRPAPTVASAIGEIGTRPLLGERPPCSNPDCSDGMVGGFGDDGRPAPVTPCPTCHVLGATA